jgi:hypothetical protein
MRITTSILLGGIMSSIAGVGLACEMPKLAIFPAKDQAAGKEAEIRAFAQAYFDSMNAYAGCIQAALAAAGGDAAPEVVKRVYVLRNNAAAAEAEFMMEHYTDLASPFGALSDAAQNALGGAAPAAPPATPPAN